MKRTLLAASSLAVLVCLAAVASATGNSVPKQAKKIQLEMVTAFNPCTAPTLTHRPSLALPSCVPAASSTNDATNVYEFGYKDGKPYGTMRALLKVANGKIQFRVKSRAILKNGSLYSGDDLTATAIVRLTDSGCGHPGPKVDCTVVDLPFPVPLTCTSGVCESSTPVFPAVVGGPPALHPGDVPNVEIDQLSILDEDGDAFARGGVLVL